MKIPLRNLPGDNDLWFFTETNNPVQIISAKHCQTNSEVTHSVILNQWLQFSMCTISLIPNLVFSCMLKCSHKRGEPWHTSFLNIKTKQKQKRFPLYIKIYEGENCNTGVGLASGVIKKWGALFCRTVLCRLTGVVSSVFQLSMHRLWSACLRLSVGKFLGCPFLCV